MTLICGQLSQSFVRNCNSKPIGGVRARVWALNQDDILSITFDSTNPLIVSAITMLTGKRAWTWDVFKRNHKPKATQKDTTYSVNYQHELVTYIPEWDSVTKYAVEQLANGYYVIIVQNLQVGTDTQFEVYGIKAGMRSQDGAVRDLGANEGVMTLTLANDADMFEDHLPASFVVLTSSVYDPVATLAAIVTLETPAP